MPDLDDFHAFTSTSSGTASGNAGCSGCFTWVVIAVLILWIIGKLLG